MPEIDILVKNETHEDVVAVTLTDIRGELSGRILRQIEQIHDLEVVR